MTEQNSEETEIDLLEIFYLLRAKLVWLILAFVIGGVIAGSITHFLITPKYTATAKMYMISASSGSVLDLSDFNIGTSLSQDYTELIKIRPVFNEVIDNLNLDMEYEDLFEESKHLGCWRFTVYLLCRWRTMIQNLHSRWSMNL